jgi:RNA polymerase sigma-70 factor (ECF subfamily)
MTHDSRLPAVVIGDRRRGASQTKGTGRDSPATQDAQVLARLAAGEITALGDLYDAHHSAVRSFLSRATGDPSAAEDLTQATFLEVIRAAASFDGRNSCHSWLIGIAVHMLCRYRHASKRFQRALDEFRETAVLADIDPEQIVSARRDLSRVEKALYAMTESKRAALLLAEVEGMSCGQIAEILEIPVGTVWTRLHHARRALSDAIARKTRR